MKKLNQKSNFENMLWNNKKVELVSVNKFNKL